MFGNTYSSWLHTLAFCCGPPSPRLHGRGRTRRECPSGSVFLPSATCLLTAPEIEKDVAVWSDEPAITPPPTLARHLGSEDGWSNGRTHWPSIAQTTTTVSANSFDAVESVAAAAAAATAESTKNKAEPVSTSQSRSRSRSGSFGGRRSSSVRRRFRRHGSSSSRSIFSISSSQRPQISAPTNFRHLHSESFAFPPLPQQQSQQRPPPFHPLELNLYGSETRTSPLVSSLDLGFSSAAAAGDEPIVPPRTHTRGGSTGSSTLTARDRSYSTMSFHVPRRPLPTDVASSTKSVRSGKSAGGIETPAAPSIPPRSRLRSYSSPAVESMVERIAGALIEMEKLQADIDSAIERQSLYDSSRPSTACGLDFEPMPSIPALPSLAPSFAERLSTERPKTAPPRNNTPMSPIREEARSKRPSIVPEPLCLPPRVAGKTMSTSISPEMTPKSQSPDARSSEDAMISAASVVSAVTAAAKAKAAASSSAWAGPAWAGPRISGRPVDVPLPPPLPLVLRPPLRKKKSFSRVSNWLFPGDSGHNSNNDGHQQRMHKRGMSFDSVTNVPKPVTDRDGFYQCVLPQGFGGRAGDRTTLDTEPTVDTLSTWTAEQGELERRQPSSCQAGESEDDMDEEIYANEDEDEDDEDEDQDQTVSTGIWSLSGSPVTTRHDTETVTPTTVTTMTPVVTAALATEKASIFGDGTLNRPQSVGVAF